MLAIQLELRKPFSIAGIPETVNMMGQIYMLRRDALRTVSFDLAGGGQPHKVLMVGTS